MSGYFDAFRIEQASCDLFTIASLASQWRQINFSALLW